MKFVYLAGAISGVEDPQTWRRQAAQMLPQGWAALDPCQFELDIETDAPEVIVRTDLHEILQCSVVLVNASVPSWGTAMELWFAKSHHIPVVAFDDTDSVESTTSPWLDYVVTHWARDLETAVGVLKRELS